ncbi:MAG: hypothetical protein M3R51_05455 [Candidatus Eremiobacteraeota bacterium]|nr:hypothetical protein [Candidatus Eremiobacteraeota bacterium]
MEKDSDTTSQGRDTDFRENEKAGTAGKEAGRVDTEDREGRPTGKSTGRDSTSVNPSDPIDPKSPNLIGP